MNKILKGVNQEEVLFFDLEVVRRNNTLEVGSREFNLYRKKTKDRVLDKFLSDEQVIKEYEDKAALKMCYTRIVSIGVGFIKGGEVHIKALDGEEEDILREFCKICQSFNYISGANILGYDLPMLATNGYRYFDVSQVLPDRFITNGKKTWNLDKVLDVMDIFKGTHYTNSSLDEICYHFDLESPKTDLDGSMVSNEFWTNGVERISKYVKQDVFANINVFKKMRFEEPFKDFIDKNLPKVEGSVLEVFFEEEKVLPLTKLFNTKGFGEYIKDHLRSKKILKKDKDKVKELVLAHYLEIIDVVAMNKKELNEINETRTKEVEEFFKTLN